MNWERHGSFGAGATAMIFPMGTEPRGMAPMPWLDVAPHRPGPRTLPRLSDDTDGFQNLPEAGAAVM